MSFFNKPTYLNTLTDLEAEQEIMEHTTASSKQVSNYLAEQKHTGSRQHVTKSTAVEDFVNWKRQK
jgi:hypothetical protein